MSVLPQRKSFFNAGIAALLVCCFVAAGVVPSSGQSSIAVIKGVVKAQNGTAIADATVAIFKAGTATLLKQVNSAPDGSFLARIAPGKYTVLAVAQGFNPVTIADVEVLRSAQLTYGFKLERSGSGNTLPEKRVDRNNPKWARRSTTLSRSIYQNAEGETVEVEEDERTADSDSRDDSRLAQTVAESYFASTDEGGYVGVNFATFLPVTEATDLVLAAQAGSGANAPQRFETQVKFRPNDRHQVRVSASIGRLGTIVRNQTTDQLGHFSVQATDEWKVREGLILVYGFDYARFFGAGSDFSLSPRLGVQYDVNSKTRLRSALTTQTEDKDWSRAIALEDAQVIFREPVAMEDIYLVQDRPVMNRSTRFEVGFERVLDNSSSIDTNLFFDTAFANGVGLLASNFTDASFATSEFTGNQQGDAQGLSVVYTRRLNGWITTKAGYSFGRGQSLSASGVTNPSELFENGFFQSFFGQVDADITSGTNIRTVFRLSPDATVFAIDPFQGRVAIYDPSLSVLITQNLPSLGLPIEAQAIVDARNVLDFHTGVTGDDGTLKLSGRGRTLRGGIQVRF